MAKEDTFLSASEASADLAADLSAGRRGRWLPGLARRLVLGRLQRLAEGRLVVVEGESRLEFGEPSATFPLQARVIVHDPAFWERLAWGGSIGAGEAWCAGLWSTPDLTAVVRVLARNQGAMDDLDQGTARFGAPLRRLLHRLRTNTCNGSLRNIAAHYDTGNDFFAQFLDPTLTYSCAIFPDGSASLDTAQRYKLDTVCRKLELGRHDRLIEIGTGWGGLALHAAGEYGCRVTTTTISQQQFDFASRLITKAGLADRVTVLREDYRQLPDRLGDTFDKLVSIEMIEAVGHAYLPRYCQVVDELLRPGGLALLQAILIPAERYESYRRSVDFIQHYIFPGGLLPSFERIEECMQARTELELVEVEDLTPHYARTLAAWRRRFEAHEDHIAALGLSAAERRKWLFYFSYCEGGFHERTVTDAQLLFAKRPEKAR